MNPVAEFAPQVRRKSSTFSQMMEFFGCVIVLWASAIAFYWVKRGMNEGIIAIFNGLAGIGFALAIDLIWEFRLLWNKENKGRKFREYFLFFCFWSSCRSLMPDWYPLVGCWYRRFCCNLCR